MALEFAQRIRRIPVYPVAAGYDLGADVAMLASNESCFGRRRRRSSPPPRPRWPARTATPTPPTRRCAPRWPTATASRPAASRWATARATSCSPRARRCSSPRPKSSTPGRRSASTRTSPPPPGARAIQVPLDADARHDLDAMRGRDHRGHPAGARLQPQQPDLDRARSRRDRGLPGAGAAPRVRDPRRGLLRVLAGHRRSVRLGRAAAPPSQPRAAADLLQGVRPGRPAGRLRAVRLRRVPHRGRPGAPAASISTWPPRPAAVEALRHQDEVERRVSHTVAERLGLAERDWPIWAAGWRSPTPTSSGSRLPGEDPAALETAVLDGSARAGRARAWRAAALGGTEREDASCGSTCRAAAGREERQRWLTRRLGDTAGVGARPEPDGAGPAGERRRCATIPPRDARRCAHRRSPARQRLRRRALVFLVLAI